MSSQHLFATLFLLLGLSSAPAFAARDMLWENEEYIGQNLRPSNITGLYSWMYGWIGSYYNGTLSIQMDVVDWTNGGDKYDTEEKPCSELVNTTIEVSYNAVVGFTKPLLEDENPLMFVLNAWEDGTDLTTGAQDADYKGWDDLPFRTASVEPASHPAPPATSPNSASPLDPSRAWNLTTTLLPSSDHASYSLNGTYNDHTSTPIIPLKFNHSTCSSPHPSKYEGDILVPDDMDDADGYSSRFSALNVAKGRPTLRGRFDNSSASATIQGYFSADTRGENDRDGDGGRNGDKNFGGWAQQTIAGLIKVDFLGEVDEVRSDRFGVAGNGTPTWESTLGFGKGLDGEESRAVRIGWYGYGFYLGLVFGVGLVVL